MSCPRSRATIAKAALAAALSLALPPLAARAHATPSTTVWAPATPALQGFGVLHLSYDTYFGTAGLYPVDLGLTMGILPWRELQLEVGVDVLYPTPDGEDGLSIPIYLNGKIGTPEDTFFAGQPGWSAGIYNAGFKSDVTDYDILYAMVGKTFGGAGTLSAGGYYGLNDNLLVDADGEGAQAGFLGSYVSPAIDVPRIDKVVLAADVQTGKNALGAVGAGVSIYFTPAVALLTGPIFFLEPDLQPGQADWMWSAQLDVDLDFTSKTPETP
ncbi:MAG TPA: hypothetical protein VKB80_01555 [Kofleriaceae bacterium]|nr:hypothetical protein [Kofleriaceae bacterium]